MDIVADVKLQPADDEAAFGVWCRGRPADGAISRYDLWINGRGEAAISKQRPDDKPTYLDGPTQTKEFHRQGANHIAASCSTRGERVELRLFVNGSRAASATDKTSTYPAGEVGVVAAAGPSQRARVRFEYFECKQSNG